MAEEALFKKTQEKMDAVLAHFKQELAHLRTGRASLSMLDDIRVNYGGTPMALNQVATLAVPEPRLITIQPWDASLVSEIEKTINKSRLGLTPTSDGKIVRLPIPSMTEERRKDIVKQAKQYAEEAKVQIRQERRDANEALKAAQKGSKMTEDDLKRGTDRVQKLTDERVAKVDELLAHKEKEILTV